MLDKLMILLGISANDDKEELLELLIKNAKAFATFYCNLPEYSSDMDFIIIKMVVEDYNKLGSEGLNSRSFSGVSESYIDGYSEAVLSQLKMFSKKSSIRVL